MPGNEVGDTIHNFFPHEKPQKQNHLPSLDGNWPVGNNVWAESQRRVASVNPSPKNYNIQKSDSEREQIGLHLRRQHGLNFTNASQLNQTSQGLFMYGSPQVNGPENELSPSVRAEASGSPARIDFLGGQQQVNYQQLNMLQSLQLQQSRLNDMQQLPPQIMFTKIQEFQRQQQLQQADSQQQNIPSQIPAFAKQGSGNHSLSMINGTQIAVGLGFNWASELGNTNSVQRNTPSLQGSSGGLAFSPNQSPARRAVDFVPQQAEQSLYGVSVSDTRSSWNQYPPLFADTCAVQQGTTLGNHTSATQYNSLPGQVNLQDGPLLGKQRSQGEDSFGPVSGQTPSLLQVENLQQLKSSQGSVSQQEFHARQVLNVACETLQGKAETLITSSQEDVALDPTEERILFGSDDNIWAAFGNNTGTDGEGDNLFDGVVLSGSIQCGTWSALMQSAVAETSSGDQEEWSGLSFQATPVNECTRVGNEPVRVDSHGGNESSKGVDQFSSRQSDAIPAHNVIAGARSVHGNASHSLNSEIRKRTSSPLTPETSGSRQEVSMLEGENNFGSVMPHEDADVMVHGCEGSLKHSWGNDQMHVMRREVLQSGNLEWANSCVSSAELEQVKSSAGNVQGNNEGFHLTTSAMIGSTIADHGSNNSPQGSYNVNYWKHADSVVNSANEAVGGIQHDNKSPNEEGKGHHKENSDQQDNPNDIYHSNSSCGAPTAVPWESESIDVNELRVQSAATHESNQTGRKNSALRKFQYHPMGNLNDNMESPNGFKQPMHSEAMAQFDQPKFYGQMPKDSAEMDKELPPGHHRSIKGFDDVLAPDNFAGLPVSYLAPSNRTSDIQEPNRGSHSSHSMLGLLLQKVDGSGEDDVRIRSSLQNSPSVLPQAENCDQSVGWLQRSQSPNSQGFGLHLGPPLKHSLTNHVLTSQSILQIPNSSHFSRACSDTVHEGSAQLVPESRVHSVPTSSDRFQGISNTDSSGLPGPPGDAMSSHNQMSGNYSTSNTGFPYSSGQLQNQETTCGSGQMARSPKKEASASWKGELNSRPCISHSAEASLPDKDGNSHDNSASTKDTSPHFSTSFSLERVSTTPPLPVSQPQSIVGSPSLGSSNSNLWTNMSAQQHLLRSQLQKMTSQFMQPNQQKIVNSSSPASFCQTDGGDARNQGTFCFEFPATSVNLTGVGPEEKQSVKEGTVQPVLPGNVNLVKKNSESHDKVPAVVRTQSDGYPENSISSHRDIDASDRSLKPDSLFQKECSLTQMHAVQNLGNDHRSQVLKRMEGQGSHVGSQIVASRAGQTNGCDGMTVGVAVSINGMSSGETTLLSFPGPAKKADKSSTSEHRSVTRQGMLMLNQDLSESGSGSPRILDHSQISPQMIPSWFSQYGTFKNEQMLPVHYARLASTLKSGEQPLNEVSNNQQSAPPSSVVAEHLSSQDLPVSVNQHKVIMRTKKRKSATSELQPWHEEVQQASRDLGNISMAEFEWSKAANRLAQKVEDVEEGPLLFRSKRRLILTTLLMQQLLRPPSAAILSMEANSHYETLIYSLSRVALGDACRMISSANRDCLRRVSDDCTTSTRLDQHLLKVAEELTARARKLGNEFLRLNKGASVSDLIVECQDIERILVLNRFAKFHGRSQAENAKTASSNSYLKPCPQRFVTALPFPRNLPMEVRCHSM